MQRHAVLLLRSGDCGWTELQVALSSMPEVVIVGETTELESLLQLAVSRRPDVIIASSRINGEATLPFLKELRNNHLVDLKILVIGGRFAHQDLIGVVEVGAIGFILWNDLSVLALRRCLNVSIVDEIFVASREVVSAFARADHHPSEAFERSPQISERERTVLNRLAQGLTLEQIAQVEPISCRTAERIVAQLKVKFCAPSLFALAMKADRFGLLG